MLLTHGPFGATPFNKDEPPTEKLEQHAAT